MNYIDVISLLTFVKMNMMVYIFLLVIQFWDNPRNDQETYLKTLFLSELDYNRVEDCVWPVQVNQSITNGPLLIGSKRFSRGIGTHADFSMTINLGGDATRFRAYVGVDAIKKRKSPEKLSVKPLDFGENLYFLPLEEPQFVCIGESPREIGRGSVVFSIWADGAKVWESPVMRGGEPPERVDLNLRGLRSITLEVSDAGDGRNGDHADWAEARILYRRFRPEIE
ncbi:MAG: NPCBM/NEW2 domain-containing protein [Bacteroidetes bacterium]|nr:NPCBM/NEW2 domain-containing protein [Bacteroidota bacterium]